MCIVYLKMKLLLPFLLIASLHLLQSYFTFAILVRAIDEYKHLTIKRETSAQVGSGLFVDVTNDSTRSSLMSALLNVTSHTTIRLEPGNYVLEEFVLMQNVTNVTLEGNGEVLSVSILCTTRAGLAFINIPYLTIRNITVDGRGFTGGDIENTIDILNDTVNIFYVIPPVVRIGMLLGHCENLIMEHVIVKNTRGLGLMGVNVIGVSQLRNVLFFNNTNPGVCLNISILARAFATNLTSGFIGYESANQIGGAAFFVFFDYHNQTIYQDQQFMLSLRECTFLMNAECSYIQNFNSLRSIGRGDSRFLRNAGYRLGGSGAFTLTLAQYQYGIDVNVISSSFRNNSATFGGGFATTLFAGVHNTHVTLDDCIFYGSSMLISNDVRLPANFQYRPYSSSRDTTISILTIREFRKSSHTLQPLFCCW